MIGTDIGKNRQIKDKINEKFNLLNFQGLNAISCECSMNNIH